MLRKRSVKYFVQWGAVGPDLSLLHIRQVSMFGGPYWLLPAFALTPVLMQLPFLAAGWLALVVLAKATDWLGSVRPWRFAGAVFVAASLLHLIVWALAQGWSLKTTGGVSQLRVLGVPMLFATLALSLWGTLLVVRGRLTRISSVKVCAVMLVVFLGVQEASFYLAQRHITSRSIESHTTPSEAPR